MKGRDPLKDVLCSLEYGVLYLGWKRALFWAGAFGMIFGFGGLFVWLAVDSGETSAALFVLGMLITVSCGAFLVVWNIKNEMHIADARKWLKDAVRLTVFAHDAGSRGRALSVFCPGWMKEQKIVLRFRYAGRRIEKYSGGENGERFAERGYFNILAHYVDREINILYSPKYDQVLILKEDVPSFGIV